MAAYTVCISYAHQDEPLKDQLAQQRKVLQRHGLIASWDDRCIDAGDKWRNNIGAAIDVCDLALLLVSPAFIASDYSVRRSGPLHKRSPARGLARRRPANPEATTDFFVSYNKADKAWAEWIAWQFEEAEYTTIIQAWDFAAGGTLS